MTGYSHWQDGLVQCNAPWRRVSPSAPAVRPTASGESGRLRERHSGQTGRRASKWRRFKAQPPIMTVVLHGGRILPVGDGMGATQEVCAVMSPIRAAGLFSMSTVIDPMATMPGPAGTHVASTHGWDMSLTRAAGR